MGFGSEVNYLLKLMFFEQFIHKFSITDIALYKLVIVHAFYTCQIPKITCIRKFIQYKYRIMGMFHDIGHIIGPYKPCAPGNQYVIVVQNIFLD